jgi:hypothetical protein
MGDALDGSSRQGLLWGFFVLFFAPLSLIIRRGWGVFVLFP